MKDFSVFLVNSSGVAFPNTTAINATGPSATDGTEWVKAWCDEFMGITQAMLDRASLTPTGVSEAAGAGNSQFLEALNLIFGGPGKITEWAGNLDPAVSGHRAIRLEGQGVLRASFPDLDTAVYVGDANNAAVAAGGGAFYRADDAAGTTPNIAGVYLILPESRGVVPRGLDLAATIDPLGAARFLGDLQIDAFQGWQLGADEDDTGAREYWGRVGARDFRTTNGAQANETTPLYGTTFQGNSQMLLAKDDGTNGTPRTGTETRMYNRSTRFVIWY